MCQSTEEEMQMVKAAFGEMAEICLRYCSCVFLCVVQSLAIQIYWHGVKFQVHQYANSL